MTASLSATLDPSSCFHPSLSIVSIASKAVSRRSRSMISAALSADVEAGAGGGTGRGALRAAICSRASARSASIYDSRSIGVNHCNALRRRNFLLTCTTFSLRYITVSLAFAFLVCLTRVTSSNSSICFRTVSACLALSRCTCST